MEKNTKENLQKAFELVKPNISVGFGPATPVAPPKPEIVEKIVTVTKEVPVDAQAAAILAKRDVTNSIIGSVTCLGVIGMLFAGFLYTAKHATIEK